MQIANHHGLNRLIPTTVNFGQQFDDDFIGFRFDGLHPIVEGFHRFQRGHLTKLF